jgi:hypothetical protein
MDSKDAFAVVLVLVAVAAVLWSFLSGKDDALASGVGFYPSMATRFLVRMSDGSDYVLADGFLIDLDNNDRCRLDETDTAQWDSELDPDNLAAQRGFGAIRMLTKSGADLYVLVYVDRHATLAPDSTDGLTWVEGYPPLDVDPRTLPMLVPTADFDPPSYVTYQSNTYAVRSVGDDAVARYALISATLGCLIPNIATPTNPQKFPEFGLINGELYPNSVESTGVSTWMFARGNSMLEVETTDDEVLPDSIETDSLPALTSSVRVFDVYNDDDSETVVGIYRDDGDTKQYYQTDSTQLAALDIYESVLDRTDLSDLFPDDTDVTDEIISRNNSLQA